MAFLARLPLTEWRAKTVYLRRDRKNRRGAPYVGGVDGSYIVDIIKFSLDLRDNRRIRWYRSYNARHRCPLFVDIVQVNWSLGRCWRSSPGSDSTMSHIMLRPPSPSFAPASLPLDSARFLLTWPVRARHSQRHDEVFPSLVASSFRIPRGGRVRILRGNTTVPEYEGKVSFKATR